MESNFNKKIIVPLVVLFIVAIGGLLSLQPKASAPIQDTAAVGLTNTDFQLIINQINDLINQAKSVWAKITPTGFRATPSMATKSLVLSWDSVSGTNQYLLEKRINGSSWSNIATIAKSSSSYSDTKLTYATTYAYRVKASNSYGETAYSPEIVIITPTSGTSVVIKNPTSTNPTPVPVNGTCGTANNVSSVTSPTINLCSPGTASSVTISGSNWSWTCAGSGGGTSAICTAPKTVSPTPINGTCGSAQNNTYLTAPTSNLCSVGTASSVTLSGTAWNWTCAGANGGTTISCSAAKTTTPTPVNGTCGTAQGVSSATAPTINLCSAGTASSITLSGTNWTWSCAGSNSGTTASCVAPKTADTPIPIVGNRPGLTNTGPTSALQNSSVTKITTNGTVIQNANLGCITIDANNVTIKNFRINGNRCLYGIKIVAGRTGTVLEDGEISNVGGTGIYGSDWTGRRLNIHDIGQDGIKASGNVTLEHSWLHGLGDAGTHADGVQTRKGFNFHFSYNNFDMPINQTGYTPNAAFMLETADGASGDFYIDHNWLNGGNNTINISTDGATDHTNMNMTNNLFGHDYRYGTHAFEPAGNSYVWTNNTWVDTGATIAK